MPEGRFKIVEKSFTETRQLVIDQDRVSLVSGPVSSTKKLSYDEIEAVMQQDDLLALQYGRRIFAMRVKLDKHAEAIEVLCERCRAAARQEV